ncbi:hypothetical protein [Xylanibacillus composti]|uniref:hypothetical protein n=1 Tax=Xylanibacillus composti TaxID=1572762 RepID=UPI001BD18712|nr:hypothetical protein [Xylanibacillus composti]
MLGMMQFFQKFVHEPLLMRVQTGMIASLYERINAFFQQFAPFVIRSGLGHTPYPLLLFV